MANPNWLSDAFKAGYWTSTDEGGGQSYRSPNGEIVSGEDLKNTFDPPRNPFAGANEPGGKVFLSDFSRIGLSGADLEKSRPGSTYVNMINPYTGLMDTEVTMGNSFADLGRGGSSGLSRFLERYGPALALAAVSGGMSGFIPGTTAIGAAGTGAAGAGLGAGFAGEGAVLAPGVFGGTEAAVGALSAADTLGLQQMGEAAGLSGSALDSFVASGGTAGSTAAGGGGIVGGYTQVDPSYGVNPRTTNTGTADPFTSPDIPEIYQGPQPPQPLPNTPPINYGMTPTGTPPGGLTPTGGGVGLTQTAPSGAAITGGVAGAAGSAAVPGTLATGANAAVGGITGSGTSVFDTFLDNLSKNPVQTAIKSAQVVSGIASGVTAMNAPMSPTDAQRMADPFASSRQQYIDKLNALMANPSLVMSQPGYQFALQQGMQELNRNLSKSGMSTSTPGFPGTPASGAAGIAQQKYGQNFALKSYNDYVNQLSGLSGATQRPSAGSDAFMNAQKAASEAANSGWKSISQASGGLLDLFGGKSPQTGSTTNTPPVGGGAAAGGTTSGGGGNFSQAEWNNPNWYLNPSPSQDITIPNNFDTGGDINYSDYDMYGP